MSCLEEELAQLTDMGIPRPRARAALKRCKGDAMAAAERVFAGEFDNVASDAEDSDGGPEPSGSKPQANNSHVGNTASSDVYDSDEESEREDLELGEFDELDDLPRGQDPYAGVFFPKDRVEELVEPRVDNVFVTVPIKPGTNKDDPHASSMKVRILSRGEWMSGCPEGGEQSFLFQLYDQLSENHMPCSTHGCGHKFARHPQNFFSLYPDFSSYAAHLAAIIEQQCPKCGETTCFACGENCKQPATKNGKGKAASSAEHEALFHCSNIQGVIIGVGLHMIEKEFGTDLDTNPSSGPRSRPSKKRKAKGFMAKLLPPHVSEDSDDSSEGDSVARPVSSAPRGTGYSGGHAEDRTGQLRVERARAEKDKRTAELLHDVSSYLPSFKRDSGTRTSDLMVHPTALAHLRRRSGFVNDLLSSDSLLDMTDRGELYRALLNWLEIISNHDALASMLAMPAMRPRSYAAGPDRDSVTVTYEASASPRELLEAIVIQASAALKGLSATSVARPEIVPEPERRAMDIEEGEKDSPSWEEAQEVVLKTFCERILSARDKIDRQLTATKGAPFVKRMMETLPGRQVSTGVAAMTNKTDVENIYVKWATEQRFKWCDLHNPADESQYLHYFQDSAAKLAGLDLPRRSVAIAKELSLLAQNIPSSWGASIFLRVDETRVDILKALIIGPPGTPYANGCFLFDIFLPQDYNLTSPNVQSMTTNGGKYRYNPNLYADGKVCLSLLGTWSGPGWMPGKSTLLQVLVSIQSLILCDEPYLNEPGWASQGGSAASKAYSANVRRMTMVDAMANNIRKPPFPFEEEIKTHFTLKANEIREQLKQWKAIDDGHGTTGEAMSITGTGRGQKSKFAAAAKELMELLDGLEEEAMAKAAASSGDEVMEDNEHMEEEL